MTSTPPTSSVLPPSRARRALRHWGPQLAFLLVAFLGIRAWQLRGAAEGPAPAITGRSVQDPAQELSLAALRGQTTLVYFWATWCGVCEHVDPNVAAVARDHQVLTVAVNSGSSAEIAAWMAERGLDMPTVSDPTGALARAYGVRAFPTSFWVDAQGEIQAREVGYTTTWGLRARLWLARRGEAALESPMVAARARLGSSPRRLPLPPRVERCAHAHDAAPTG